MKLCGHIFRDALGAPFRWRTGPQRGSLITCDLPAGHGGNHSADAGIYRWED